MDGREVGWEGLDGMRLDEEGGWMEGRLDARKVGCKEGWMEGRLDGRVILEKPLALYLPFSSHSNLKVRFSPCS